MLSKIWKYWSLKEAGTSYEQKTVSTDNDGKNSAKVKQSKQK